MHRRQSHSSLFIATVLLAASGLLEPTESPAQSIPELTQALVDAGFENVKSVAGPDGLVVTLENRKYRYDVTGFIIAEEIIRGHMTDDGPATLVMQRRGLPLRTIHIRPDGSTRSTPVVETDQRYAALSSVTRSASSFAKTDLAIRPEFRYQLGNYADNFRAEISIIPELQTSLWKGNGILAQLIIPIYDDLDDQAEVRPGILSINQTVRLPYGTFASLTAGIFREERYGFDLETRTYLLDGRLSFGARLGYTGFGRFDDWAWFYSDLETWSGSFRIDVTVPEYGILLHSRVERYVDETEGLVVGVSRAFNEVRVGFFGFISEGQENAGVTLSIPLFPGSYSDSNWIRIRPAREFVTGYAYRFGTDSGYSSDWGGSYLTGHEIERLWQGVLPGLFDSHRKRRAGS